MAGSTRGRKKATPSQQQRRKKLNQPSALDGWRGAGAEDRVGGVARELSTRRAPPQQRPPRRAPWIAGAAVAAWGVCVAAAASARSERLLSGAVAAAALALLLLLATAAAVAAATTEPPTADARSATPASALATAAPTTRAAACTTTACAQTPNKQQQQINRPTMMFQISRLVQVIHSVRRSVLEYATAAPTPADACADACADDPAAGASAAPLERERAKQVGRSAIEIAPAFQPPAAEEEPPRAPAPPAQPALARPKLKRKTRGRASSMYSSTVTIEEFTELPARRRSSIASFDEYMDVPERHLSFVTIEEYTVLPARRPGAITTPAVSPPTSRVAPDATTTATTTAAIEQAVEATKTPKKPRTRRRSRSLRPEDAAPRSASPPSESCASVAGSPSVARERVAAAAERSAEAQSPAAVEIVQAFEATSADAERDAVIASDEDFIEAEAVEVEAAVEVVEAEAEDVDTAAADAAAEEPAVEVEKIAISVTDITATTTTTQTTTTEEAAEDEARPSGSDPQDPPKGKRRRSSRRRSRASRRSAQSLPERPSFYDEFLRLEPVLAKRATLPLAVADAEQARYAAEAARARALSASPVATAGVTTPAIRLLLEDLNAQLSRTHAALAANWEFLAALSAESAAAAGEPEPEDEPACGGGKLEPALSLDSTEVDDDEPALRYSELEGEEDDDCGGAGAERFGDVDYDDHYYSYHPMSAPCV